VPAELQRAVVRDAERIGLTQSEYVRGALVAFLMWHQALCAIDNGHSSTELHDPQVIAQFLGLI
jgi:hypothetical protein